ncbi:MAG TPA: helix-turn-helix transcriptional regulator [Rhodoferax sp.]
MIQQPLFRMREGVGVTARIVQRHSLAFARVPFDHPVLIVVQRGTKTLRASGCEWEVPAGHAIAINRGQTLDIRNLPDAQGAYEARWLVWDESLLELHYAQTASSRRLDVDTTATRVIRSAWPLGALGPTFMQAVDAAIASILEPDTTPLEVARHRMRELLVWVGTCDGHFETFDVTSMQQRVRDLLSASPHSNWTAAQVGSALAMSEATLRRRLMAEGVRLSELLVDVRMSLALTLLQATSLPVTQIAMNTGYESPSRFAVRFRQRFGFAPTAVRGHQRASH